MGIIRQGALGGFKGKAGAVIGSSWKSIDYIKGLYKKRSKPASEEQMIQQARFLTIAKFLMPITPLLKLGFGHINSDKMTPSNAALQLNIKQAVSGSYPNFELDYSKVLIASGSYIGGGTTAASVAAGLLSVDWSSELNALYDSKADDQVYILLYQPTADEFMTPAVAPTRAEGTVDIQIPTHLLGAKGHVWIFFADRKMTKVSRSSYLGELDLV